MRVSILVLLAVLGVMGCARGRASVSRLGLDSSRQWFAIQCEDSALDCLSEAARTCRRGFRYAIIDSMVRKSHVDAMLVVCKDGDS